MAVFRPRPAGRAGDQDERHVRLAHGRDLDVGAVGKVAERLERLTRRQCETYTHRKPSLRTGRHGIAFLRSTVGAGRSGKGALSVHPSSGTPSFRRRPEDWAHARTAASPDRRRTAAADPAAAADGVRSDLDGPVPAGASGADRRAGAATSVAQLTVTACLIGLAAGQLIAGPLSDRFGRRGILLIGIVAYIATSALCAISPTIELLIVARFVQGLAGGVGIVIAQAAGRDIYTGGALIRFYGRLTVVGGFAAIVGPLLGGLLNTFTDWRGLFVFLAVIGAGILVVTLLVFRETLPADQPHPRRVRADDARLPDAAVRSRVPRRSAEPGVPVRGAVRLPRRRRRSCCRTSTASPRSGTRWRSG